MSFILVNELFSVSRHHCHQVLVPLVLLQALQSEGQSVRPLLDLGLRFLEENEADYITQLGGWVSF